MKTNVIKQSTKTDWWLIKTVEFAPVIALARDRYLNPFDNGSHPDRATESCYAVDLACSHVFGDRVGNVISNTYSRWASKLGLRPLETQHERILWLSFLEQYCITEKVVLECKVNCNPFSDQYDTRLFELKSST